MSLTESNDQIGFKCKTSGCHTTGYYKGKAILKIKRANTEKCETCERYYAGDNSKDIHNDNDSSHTIYLQCWKNFRTTKKIIKLLLECKNNKIILF